MRQEKTLALACVPQACAERSGVATGVLCNVAHELQKCMAPLINLTVDDIVEVSLLESPGEESETSPTLEEEATLLDKEHEPLEAPEAAASSQMTGDPQVCRTH